MYIRWVVRKHKSPYAAHLSFHDAYLVESYRNEDDSPRQRVITYLGNIRELDDHFPAIERELFLLRAQITLAQMPEISHEDQEYILELLYTKVQPLSHDEVEHAFHNNLQWYQEWCRQENKPLPTVNEIHQILTTDEAEEEVAEKAEAEDDDDSAGIQMVNRLRPRS